MEQRSRGVKHSSHPERLSREFLYEKLIKPLHHHKLSKRVCKIRLLLASSSTTRIFPLSPDKFLNAVPNERELIYYLLIRSQKRKTILTYSHDEEASLKASTRKRYLYTINKFFCKGLVFPIDLVYLVNSVQIIYT